MTPTKEWLDGFPELLASGRRRLGLSRRDLAERLGVTRQALDLWERGVSLPSLPAFLSLAELFGWPSPHRPYVDATDDRALSR